MFFGAGWIPRWSRYHTIALTDHTASMGDLLNYLPDGSFMDGPAPEAADVVWDSNHYPIVVVGHSLGALTAYNIATQSHVDLLVTLDGASLFLQGLPHRKNFRSSPPELAVRWIDVSATGQAAGLGLIDRDGQESADVLRADFVADRGDVKKCLLLPKKKCETH